MAFTPNHVHVLCLNQIELDPPVTGYRHAACIVSIHCTEQTCRASELPLGRGCER